MDFETARAELIKQLSLTISDRRVLAAMARIPREYFVPAEERDSAYEDRPIPIGMGQTISQPYIVALMTQALELKGNEKILEIGTGSGYQSAVLANLARMVVSVERVPSLAESAKKVLSGLGYRNVLVHHAKDIIGWPDEAPYDAIIATAGAPEVPPELIDQLAVGGRLVIPVGTRFVQQLLKITKQTYTNTVQNLGACCFVSLIGKGAWSH